MKDQTASDRVRARLREEMKVRDLSQRDLAEILTRQTGEAWNQPRVGKILNGDVALRVDDAEEIARALKLYLSEAVRDRGLEFYAEMTPTELRILERLRQRQHMFVAVMSMLEMLPPTEPLPSVRKKPKRGRPLNSEREKDRA